MLVAELNDNILCEYQIKIHHDEDDDAARKRNDFNHLLYEFERSATLYDLINAIGYTIQSLKSRA